MLSKIAMLVWYAIILIDSCPAPDSTPQVEIEVSVAIVLVR